MSATLSTLPAEILFQILSHLSPSSIYAIRSHAFLTLPLVSRALHATIESYSHHHLCVLGVTPQQLPYRKTYLLHAATHCTFCTLESYNASTLHPDIACCPRCEDAHFPRIAADTAARFYVLDKHRLFKNCHHSTGNIFDEVQVRRYAEAVHKKAEASLQFREDDALKKRLAKCVWVAEGMLRMWDDEWRELGRRRGEGWEVWKKTLEWRKGFIVDLKLKYKLPTKCERRDWTHKAPEGRRRHYYMRRRSVV